MNTIIIIQNNIKAQSKLIVSTYRAFFSKYSRRNKTGKLHKLIIDTISIKDKYKQGDKTIKSIEKRKHKWTLHATACELAYRIECGHTFIWSYLEGGVKAINFVSASILVLDFDNKIDKENIPIWDSRHFSVTQALIRAYEYNLDFCFGYTTLSHSDTTHKFRLVFQLQETIRDASYFKKLIEQLFVVFPEADKGCKSAEKKFYGSKVGSIFYPQYDKYLDLSKLELASRCCSVRVSNTNTLSRDLKRYESKFGLKTPSPSIYIEESGEINPKTLSTNQVVTEGGGSRVYSPDYSTPPNYEKLRHVNFEELCQRIKILDDFASGKKLLHPKLFGIASALQYIEGGEKWYKQIISSNPKYSAEKYYLVNVCKHSNYHVMSLHRFSPYPEDCRFSNIYEAAKINKYHWKIVETLETMTLEVAEKQLDDTLVSALNATDNPIIVIKKATGLGGTTQLANLLGKMELKAVVAFPNHALKREKIELFSTYSKLEVTPQLPANIPSEIKKQLEYYYQIGAYDTASKFISTKSKSNPALKQYMLNKFDAYKSSNSVLTTHSQAIHVDFIHSTYIFDEDPLKNILENGKVTFGDLRLLVDVVRNYQDRYVLDKYVEWLDKWNIPSTIEKTATLGLNNYNKLEDEVLNECQEGLTSEVLRFLESDYFVQSLPESGDNVRELNFIKHHSLNNDFLANKKIIIVSATASEFIYRKLYGDRVQFFDLSNVELQGTLQQDRSYSYSRRSMSQEKVIEYLNERTDGLPVITFNAFQSRIANAVPDIYFGKTEGFDEYKGRDLVVAGTPHLSMVDYLLYAAALGIEIKASDFRMSSEMITHNGIECYFNTFENEELRKIQLHFIEEQLEQAIGRARLIRTDARVVVYTNFPLRNVSDYTTIRKL
ncbi:MAG: hypothetical protein FWK04_30070 [Nostoc sp. GBBB01]|nr:hypothetical protein [Nostoc sp. GBBB01]